MKLANLMVGDLERILSAGASIELPLGPRLVADWERLAKAAKIGGGVLTIHGAGAWMVDQYVRVASAGPGHVVFKD